LPGDETSPPASALCQAVER